MSFNGIGISSLQYGSATFANISSGLGETSSAHRQFFNASRGRSSAYVETVLNERFAERARIARELHDTLLQGFFAVSMQLHAAVDQLRPDTAAKPRFSNLLEAMDRVLEEGRRAVQGLRTSPAHSPSLPQALAAVPSEMGFSSAVVFQVLVLGKPRELAEGIREELYRVGREAIINAFRHSHANHIEVQIEYRPGGVRVIVRDNGKGIDPRVLRSGRAGHWGLSGIKERTEQIGGEVRILSRAGAGTQITAFVPARVAFDDRPACLEAEWPSTLPGEARKSISHNLGMRRLHD